MSRKVDGAAVPRAGLMFPLRLDRIILRLLFLTQGQRVLLLVASFSGQLGGKGWEWRHGRCGLKLYIE